MDETWKTKHIAALAELTPSERREQVNESRQLVADALKTIDVEQTYADLASLTDQEIDRRINAAVEKLKKGPA